MKTLNAYISGFKMSIASIKMTVLIYCVNLVLGLLVAFPLLSSLKVGFGSSMLPESLLKGFDFTAFSEFMRSFKAIAGFISQARWIILLYLFLSILFSGGILFVFSSKEKFTIQHFFSGCFKYFFRFLKLFVYMTVFNLLVGLIIYVPMSIILSVVGDTVNSEATLVYIVLAAVFIHLLLFIFLQMVWYYSKIRIVSKDTTKVFRSIFRSIRFVFRNFVSTTSLFIMLLTTLLLLLIVYHFLINAIGTATGFSILMVFLVQQILILTRVFARVWFFGSQLELYERLRKQD